MQSMHINDKLFRYLVIPIPQTMLGPVVSLPLDIIRLASSVRVWSQFSIAIALLFRFLVSQLVWSIRSTFLYFRICSEYEFHSL